MCARNRRLCCSGALELAGARSCNIVRILFAFCPLASLRAYARELFRNWPWATASTCELGGTAHCKISAPEAGGSRCCHNLAGTRFSRFREFLNQNYDNAMQRSQAASSPCPAGDDRALAKAIANDVWTDGGRQCRFSASTPRMMKDWFGGKDWKHRGCGGKQRQRGTARGHPRRRPVPS